MHFSTQAIHIGSEPDPTTGAVAPPIYATSTFVQDGVGGLRQGFEYSRSDNPTRRALERCLCALEAGARGIAFASGLAAEDAIIRAIAQPGSHLVVPDDAYGGSFRLFSQGYQRWGLEVTAVDLGDREAVIAAMRPNTVAVWIESPTNPLLNISDIAALARIARDHQALAIVDNTFASPYLQQPLVLGADVVVHSTTKYCGGHSDVVGGAVITKTAELGEQIAWQQNALGAVPGPFDCWLVLRGLKTLAVRMERHSENAQAIAEHLAQHPAVSEVIYPGLVAHPGHDLAKRQMRRFGGMVSFRPRGGEAQAVAVCARTQFFTLAESLGGVESLIEHPLRMTHASVTGTPLEVPADLIRLSVGIEDVADLKADLDQALEGNSAAG